MLGRHGEYPGIPAGRVEFNGEYLKWVIIGLTREAGWYNVPHMNRYFAIIPAAGSGARLGSPVPKQYLTIEGRTLLDLSVSALLAEPRIGRVYVVIARDDDRYTPDPERVAAGKIVVLRCGGATRADSVLNGLQAAALDAGDRVLVHDAARPCLLASAVGRLIDEVGDDPNGGLLAIPVADTLKRADGDQRVTATESRVSLWQAQTPQLFPCGVLLEALLSGDRSMITDEASAVERLGLRPRLVTGDYSNLKVTYPGDLAWAGALLNASSDPERKPLREHT